MSTDPVSPAPPASSFNGRFVVLLVLLAIMVGALWYDRKVARPAVEGAYARIAKLNSDINSRGGKAYMTNKDVRNELKRTPIDQFTSGSYMVEVYGWRAGLPLKTHKYYAVYADGSPYIFLKHYMNELDMSELKDAPSTVADANAPTTDVGDAPGGAAAIAAPPPGTIEATKQPKAAAENDTDKAAATGGGQTGDSESTSKNAAESATPPASDSKATK